MHASAPRRMIIAGNWKMFTTVAEAATLVKSLKLKVVNVRHVEIVVCPPFPNLTAVAELIKGSSIRLGAQNLFWEEQGAFTGEVSARMLVGAGCQFVIIGHSERRQYFGETDESVNRRLLRALAAGLTAIVCVGETLAQRQAGATQQVVEAQARGALKAIDDDGLSRVVIAYEPVWAIGTGVNATPQQVQEVHEFIRGLLGSIYSHAQAAQTAILYGGSVKPGNAGELLGEADVDGALVGGASLEAESFASIVKAGEELCTN